MNHKSCIEDIIIGNVLRLFQFRELRRACDCTGAKLRVSQRLKSLRGIVVRNCGFSETVFFVVCDDIWIAICPSFVVVRGHTDHINGNHNKKLVANVSHNEWRRCGHVA